MSRDRNNYRGLSEEWSDDQEHQISTPSPGKITLTSRLPPRPSWMRSEAGARPSSAAVQRKAAPGGSSLGASEDHFNMALGFVPTSSPGSGAVALKASESAFTSSLGASTSSVSQLGESAPRSAPEIAQSGFSGSGSQIPYKSQMEQSFNRDFSGVRVYTGDTAAQANKSLGANAYAMGNQIAFKNPNPSPSLVAHELTHVVQQSSGGPAAHGTGIVTAGEAEADAVEAAVAAGRPASSVLGNSATEKGIAKSDDGGSSPFTMGMTFSKDGFEKSYEYTIWDRALPPVPTGIPGVFWTFQPSVKVAAKGGADWGGDNAGSVHAAVSVTGAFGVGITGGAPGVAEVYGVLQPGVSGSGTFRASDDTWSLDVGMALNLAGKIGVKLGGGIVDYAFQLFNLELIKFTGINWDQDGFHPEKFGLAWGKDIQDILDSINAIIEKAKEAGTAVKDGAVAAGNYVADKATDAYEWVTSW